jgi:hypothetical protein
MLPLRSRFCFRKLLKDTPVWPESLTLPTEADFFCAAASGFRRGFSRRRKTGSKLKPRDIPMTKR